MLLGRDLFDEEARTGLGTGARYPGVWALVKGGHGSGAVATDVLAHAGRLWLFSAPREAVPTTHGTGCSLSAAIAACLALGAGPVAAVRRAKAYVLGRLRTCVVVGPGTWAMLPPHDLPLPDIQVTECQP